MAGRHTKEYLTNVSEMYNKYGEIKASELLGIKVETLKRRIREAKEFGIYIESANTTQSKYLNKILETYSETELKIIAEGKTQILEKSKKLDINFEGNRVRIGVMTDTHIGHQKFYEQRMFAAFEEFKKEKVDMVMHAGDVCLTPDTLITTNKGLKPIEDVKEGDVVLTHTNRWNKVLKTFKREVNENIEHFHTDSSKLSDLKLTSNHPIYCTIDKSNRQVGDKCEFIEAGDVSVSNNHLLNIKDDSFFNRIDFIEIDKKSIHDKVSTHTNEGSLKINDNLFKAIGLFLGDGSIYLDDKKGATYFYLENKGKKNKIGENIVKYFCNDNGFTLCVDKKENMNQWIINSKPLTLFFSQFYDENKQKHIPLWLLNSDIDQIKYICYGLIISDGTILKNRFIRINNTSYKMLKNLKLRLECSGIYANMNLSRKEGVAKIKDKECNVKNYYELGFNNATCSRILNLFDCEERNYLAKFKYERFQYIAKTITKKESLSYNGFVYNIEVENDNSYIANGIIVHNCEGMSHRPGHIYELTHLGYDQQKKYAVELFGQWTDTPIYAIDGNHDRWYIKSNGAMIVKDIDRELNNFHFIGHDEGDIMLNDKVSIRLWHGEDGSSYALSYRIQKILESLQGGDKPNIMFCGHTHKYVKLFERNVHAISSGCMEDQTPWMRGKRISANPGFGIYDITFNNIGITKLSETFFPFY